MSQNLHYAFGRELAALRQAEFEATARRSSLIRSIRRTRRTNYAVAARAAASTPSPAARPSPASQPAPAGCAADLG